MERLSKEDYNRAKDLLKRYNYNCRNIINIQNDIISLKVSLNDGLPKAPYSVGNPTLKRAMELQENENLQKSIKEYKIVIQALDLVDEDSRIIFDEEYRNEKNRWEVIDILCKSEETYKRKKRDLIYAVYDEIKKIEKK